MAHTIAQPRLTLAALLAALATVVLTLIAAGPTASVDLRAYDLLLAPMTPRATPSRVAVVTIDDASITAVGQWPWPREVVARLVTRLRQSGASVVALDILFAEADRVRLAPDGTSSSDQALADAIAGGQVVVGYAFTFDNQPASGREPFSSARETRRRCSPPAMRGTLVTLPGQQQPDEQLFQATGAICGLDALTRPADAAGFLNVGVDTDGTLRDGGDVVGIECVPESEQVGEHAGADRNRRWHGWERACGPSGSLRRWLRRRRSRRAARHIVQARARTW